MSCIKPVGGPARSCQAREESSSESSRARPHDHLQAAGRLKLNASQVRKAVCTCASELIEFHTQERPPSAAHFLGGGICTAPETQGLDKRAGAGPGAATAGAAAKLKGAAGVEAPSLPPL